MTIAEIAQELVDLCREGRFMEVIDRHYRDDVVSIEPFDHGAEIPARVEGIEAVRHKNKLWAEGGKNHGLGVDGPFLGDGQFAVRFNMDVTPKATGKRIQMSEMALYTVENGKIVKEEFYYAPAG